MLEELTAGEYDGWVAWMRKFQPFPNRDDIHWGLLISTVTNQWASAEHRVTPYEVMPYFDQFEEELTLDDLLRRIGIVDRS